MSSSSSSSNSNSSIDELKVLTNQLKMASVQDAVFSDLLKKSMDSVLETLVSTRAELSLAKEEIRLLKIELLSR